MIKWPQVAVAPTKYVEGMGSVGDEAPGLMTLPLDEALQKRFNTDAHFVLYLAWGEDRWAASEEMPRLKKAGIVEALKDNGTEVLISSVWLDIDTNPHDPFTEDSFNELIMKLKEAELSEPLVGRWHAFYSTNGGFRMGFVLEEAIDVDEVEPYIRGLVRRFWDAGLQAHVDDLADWTRMFRLPRVNREKKGWTDEGEFYACEMMPERPPLNLKKEVSPILKEIKKREFAKVNPVARADCPEEDEAHDLLHYTNERGREVQTEWYKNAKQRSRGRDYWDYMVGARKLSDFDQRNNALTQLVGSSVGVLTYLRGTTHRLIYALWVDAVQKLAEETGDDDGRDWLDILWHLVCTCYEKEDAQKRAKEKAEEVEQQEQGKLSLKVMENVRKWCKVPELSMGDAVGLQWLSRHAIGLSPDGRYHPLRIDGFYDPVGCSLTNLPARIRELGMDTIIELEETTMGPNGPVVKKIAPQTLITSHGTAFFEREGIASGEGSYIRDIESDSATLMFLMYERRRDIAAKFDEDVDLWLRATFHEYYDEVCEWLGHALDFEGGPICALSITAPPAIGKKLLVEGLAECITTRTWASGKEMVGRFQAKMMKTPFLIIDEGLPKSRDSAMDPADAFRSLISGDTIAVEQKGRDFISIHNPMRVIVTANNEGVIRSLYQHRDLSWSDREALAQRLKHIEVGDEGAKYLASKGGLMHTGRPSKRWIRSDAGRPSDHVVARHFLWLYENRKPVLKTMGRLLVEGDNNAEIIREMAVRAGGSPEVIEVIITMLDQNALPDGMEIEDGEIYVTTNGVIQHFRTMAKMRQLEGARIHPNRVASILKGLTKRGWKVMNRKIGDGPKVRWHLLDKNILQTHATEYGLPCDRLWGMVKPKA